METTSDRWWEAVRLAREARSHARFAQTAEATARDARIRARALLSLPEQEAMA